MTRKRLASSLWKWLISALALSSALLLVFELSAGIPALLIDGRQGSLGARLNDQLGESEEAQSSHYLTILELAPDSPLRAAGALPGDKLKFDRPVDRWRKFLVGEPIGLTLYRGDSERHLRLAAQAARPTFAEQFDYWGRFLVGATSILFSLLIGFKRAEVRCYRYLAAVFAALSLMYFFTFSYSPPNFFYRFSKAANLTTYPLVWYWCVCFALLYQPYAQQGLRRWLTRSRPVYGTLAFGTAAYSCWFALGHEAPLLWLMIFLSIIGGLGLTIVSLYQGWHATRGEIRQRHVWLMASFLTGAVPGMLAFIPALDASYNGMRITAFAAVSGQLLMYLGLAYAVLRVRVFSFDFAVHRMLVYTVLSILLLALVGCMEWLAKTLLKGGGPQHSMALFTATVLVGYLLLHQLHRHIERWVRRIFFGKWHAKENQLRHYVEEAEHITAMDALLASCRAAVDNFTGQAGCAIYLRQAGGEYTLATSTLAGVPLAVAESDAMLPALRAEMDALLFKQVGTAMRGEIALPMGHRGALNGFIVVGAKADGLAYRPDECEVLHYTAHQIGLDLHALRVAALESELRQMESKAAEQGATLAALAERGRQARSLL
ncbi:hypothetical protein [Massilia sp. YIM B04103]|uniref:hypothetical protein n=1 Tax=Massilia sp. YIM B04103 TaxID=2963106 RepID=UPI00210C78F9|nr:hypothetical protein [Massilia sp. YIM B04103]